MIGLMSLLSVAATFFIVTASPGPATLSNAAIAMQYGRKTGLIYGSGLSCGLAFWGLVAASGIGALLQSSLYLLTILKIMGGLYLLWLAYLSAHSICVSKAETTLYSHKRNWFMQGLLLNVSNPKAVLAWLAALSVGLDSNDDVYAITAATAACMISGATAYLFYSILFSEASVMRAYQNCRRWIDGVMVGLFALAGFSLIRSACTRS